MKSSTKTALLLAALCAGCGSGDSGSGQSAGAPRFLSLGTAPPGGAFFVVGGAVAEVLNESGPGAWQVTAEATKGTLENIRRLARGEIDLAVANAAITYFALRGEPEGEWEQPFEMRSLVTLAPNVAMFVAQRSSGIQSLSQLKGQRVVVGVAGAGFEFFVRPLLAAHGVSYDEFTPVYNTQSGAVDLLSDGSAAAAFLGGAVPTASITQAASSGDMLLIPFDPEAREKLIADYPFFRPATIPAGTYRGQDDEYAGLDVGSMHLIVSADQDDALAYELTKTIWEHRAAVVAKHPAGRAINENNAVRDTGTPFHPGAIRYYREIGIWPEDDAESGSGAGEGGASEEADEASAS